jgi:hypothetical protein
MVLILSKIDLIEALSIMTLAMKTFSVMLCILLNVIVPIVVAPFKQAHLSN